MIEPKGDKLCPECHQQIKRRYYQPNDILWQTPPSVWEEYKKNGYTIAEAIKEEWSYA